MVLVVVGVLVGVMEVIVPPVEGRASLSLIPLMREGISAGLLSPVKGP